LINVRTGESEMLPVVSRDDGVDAMVEALMGRLRGRIPSEGNPRIAVLPLSSMRSRDYSTRLGMETAESIIAGLRREGYQDLAEPRRTESAVTRAGLTQTKIEANPAGARGVVDADYLLMGWVRNDIDEYFNARRTVIAGDSGGDSGYTTRRQEAEDFGEY
jgi:TolB-like protein